jgi:small conductance mechanosensitive channel
MDVNVEKLLTKMQEWIALYGLKAAAAVVILFVGWLAAKAIRTVIRRLMTKARIDGTLTSFISSLVYMIVMAFVIIAGLGQLGVQTASFVAVIGAAGLAVGLALQGSLSNFAAGVLMIIFKPFKAGDYIEGAGVAGTVEELGIFTTLLKSPDNKAIIVPNGKLAGDNIINYNANPTRRLDLIIRVSYGDDIDKVKHILAQIVAADDRIMKEPAVAIGVTSLGVTGIEFAVRLWVRTSDFGDVQFAVLESIKRTFDAEGIVIPVPAALQDGRVRTLA